MDTKTKLDEAAPVPDLEEQPLLPPPTAGPKLMTVSSPERELARPDVAAPPGTSPATVRTLALVTATATATAGLAFGVDLAARREYPTLVAFAASFVLFCASSSLFAWCQGRGRGQQKPPPPPLARAWPAAAAAARVLFWSFTMALVVSMTCWAADRPRVPWAAGSALGVVVSWLCLAEIAPFFGPTTVRISMGFCVRGKEANKE